ncbi:MAG: Gfo/Idh/MocA family oxidoreductase [Chloroflexi bacterium]|nr:Gfo/Idh/MocA family oxidoreductase [Chloroflexota bacterium]
MTQTNGATPLRAAVIGAGIMGRNHVRVYNEIPDVDMVGFADADAGMVANIERQFHVQGYTDEGQMLDELSPDLVTVAVPTVFHLAVARQAIERGIHVLIEKPIAESAADGQKLIDLAREHQVVLAVGHIERHNPAVRALRERIDADELGPIFELHAERVGPFPARIRDVGVVLDLATHDIDVICHLARGTLTRVFAETQQNIHSTREDTLSGLMRFDNGITGVLRVNWLTPAKSRRLRVTGAAGMYEIDYITQDLTFSENGDNQLGYDSLRMLRGVSEGRVIREKISKREPLRAELEDFIGAIRDERPPLVTGEDGLKALCIAQALVEAGQSNQVVNVSL